MCAGRRGPQVPWGEIRHLARLAGYIPRTPRRAALFHPSYCRPEKLVGGDHNTLSEPNQPLTYFTLPQHCTLWTGGNPLCSLSEIGFVPHFAWASRNRPFPGSRRPQPPIGAFWLRSVIRARRSVSASDYRQLSRSPAQECRFPSAFLRFYTVKSFTFNIDSRISVPLPTV
jgi:hypothetical protein